MIGHILVIPDGNRRFSQNKNISLSEGYRIASKKVTTMLVKQLLVKKKTKQLSFYAISYDNLKRRCTKELAPIFDAHIEVYDSWLNDNEIMGAGIRFFFLGALDFLPKEYIKRITLLEEKTVKNKLAACKILIGYNGQKDILDAVKKIKTNLNELTTEVFYRNLLLEEPIDLIIRTGGEKRLSGCPLFQAVYAELIFAKFFYPEFTETRLNQILHEYALRKRHFGK